MKRNLRFFVLFFLMATIAATFLTACKPVEVKYQVYFIANDEIVSVTESAGNEEIALPTAPNVTGFEFVGWYLDPDSWEEPFDGKNFADKPLTADVKVYAKYDKIQAPVYRVEFDTDGGTPVEAMTVSVIESAPYTEKNGFTFAGWFEDASRSEKAEFPYYPEGDTTLYALWTRNAVQFTLDSDGKISGITGSPEDGVLIIPATVNGIKVKGIAAYAFRGNTDITEVRAAEEITNFGVGCFWNCKNLASVTISDSVTNIPSDMFNGCSSLNRMNFPSALKTIEYDAFWGTAFTEIVLPDTVTEVWDYAFA